MRNLILFLILLAVAVPANATTYYLATAAGGGSDANNGTSLGTPWLSPNHAVNCGDVIQAAASTAYDPTNFASGKWGTVTCAGGNNVAWVMCVTFDSCKLTTSSANGMVINNNYWGVQGWELTVTNTGNCFVARPSSVTIHHIVFANDIANGCYYAGFEVDGGGVASVDYVAVIGSAAYGTSGGSASCTSAFNVNAVTFTTPFDTKPGTHIYFAGNFAWNNVDGNPCNGGLPTDGEGFMFDSFGSYSVQSVIDNNISLFNGGRGVLVYSNSGSFIYFRHNTVYGNNTQTAQATGVPCGEIEYSVATKSEAYLNIGQTHLATACSTNYAYWVVSGNGTDHVYQDWGYDASGNNTGSASSSGFSFGPNNLLATDATFSNPSQPGAPSCGSASSVPNCMATAIANFTPTNAAAKSYGYQIPSTTSVYDPLYPQWLCSVTNLPTGLVTPGCATGTYAGSGVTFGAGDTIH